LYQFHHAKTLKVETVTLHSRPISPDIPSKNRAMGRNKQAERKNITR
jgi:hypothetical protein